MRLVRITLLALSLIGAAGASIAIASPPGQGYVITYFDAAGEPVGGAIANPCNGAYSSWGIRTDIVTKRTLFCNRP
jgi:hypothetical protein